MGLGVGGCGFVYICVCVLREAACVYCVCCMKPRVCLALNPRVAPVLQMRMLCVIAMWCVCREAVCVCVTGPRFY